MKIEERIKIIISLISTSLTWFIGDWDIALIVLICFMLLDYTTGVMKGYISKSLSSSVGLIGIARKSLIFIVLIVSVLLDRLLNSETWVFRTLVAYFYIANEGISLLENCVGLGLPIPERIKDALVQLKEGNKKDIN